MGGKAGKEVTTQSQVLVLVQLISFAASGKDSRAEEADQENSKGYQIFLIYYLSKWNHIRTSSRRSAALRASAEMGSQETLSRNLFRFWGVTHLLPSQYGDLSL